MINIPKENLEMTQKWLARAHESSDVAHLLYQSGGHDGSIVNFAFYTMLYAVFALLTPYDVEKGVDKDRIAIAFFDDKFINTNIIPKDLSQMIHNTYDLRQAYDFQPFVEISREQALEIMNSADEFINTIEQKLSNPS